MANYLQTYFPDLSTFQLEQLQQLMVLFKEWNQKINLVSRQDIENLELHHIVHSLSIAKVFSFPKGIKVLDIGTGGGLPGIPLAILFPEVSFTLVDSISKKIGVVDDIVLKLNLKNVIAKTLRVEQLKVKFDYVVSRAVTNLPDFEKLSKPLLQRSKSDGRNKGIIYLKGGDFSDELQQIKMKYELFHLYDYVKEDYFQTKKIVFLY